MNPSDTQTAGPGSAWVFTRTGAQWVQQGPPLIAGENPGKSTFGIGVALSADGNTALIGGYLDPHGGGAYVFGRSASTWTQRGSVVTPSDGTPGLDSFGRSVALTPDGNIAAIGGGDFRATGAVWLFAAKTDQTIAFSPISSKTFGDADFSIAASASSGLPVTLTATGSCMVASSTVHVSGVGACTLVASQAGNATFNAAPSVSQSFAIAKAGQTISFAPLADRKMSDPDFVVAATATSGLPVAFAGSGDCLVNGAMVHIVGAGSCTVTAAQAGNSNYAAAQSVSRTFAIAPAVATPVVPTPVKPSVKCIVPKLVGKTLAAARRALKSKHCRAGTTRYGYSSKAKKRTSALAKPQGRTRSRR